MQNLNDTKPWERQPKESEKAYDAFVLYREMGEGRTLQSVADELRKSYTLIRRWKDTWAWKDRVRAYDNDLQEKAHKTAVKKVRQMADRHISIALKLQEKALEALEKTNAEDIDPKNLLAFLREATRLERENRADIVNATDTAKDDSTHESSLANVIAEAWERRKQSSESDK